MQEGVSPGTVGEQLDRFLDDLTIAGYSPLTVKHYRWKLRKRLPLDLPVYALTMGTLRALVADQVRTKAPGTAHTFYGMLRSFSKYLKVSGMTAVNLMDGIPEPRLDEPQTKALSQAVLARLWLAACELDSEAAPQGGSDVGRSRSDPADRTPPLGSKFNEPSENRSPPVHTHCDSTTYRLLFLLLRDTGLRRAEVAGARWDDIDGDTLRVLGKGRKWRRVLLTPEVLGLLKRSTARASDNCLGSQTRAAPEKRAAVSAANPTTRGPIFGVSPSRIGQMFAQIARRAGVKATPHSLRHTWATEFLRKGGQMEAARILGGWSDMRMLSERYGKGAIEEAALAEARRIDGSAPRSRTGY